MKGIPYFRNTVDLFYFIFFFSEGDTLFRKYCRIISKLKNSIHGKFHNFFFNQHNASP